MLAFALRADGWWLRQDLIWAKPNPMPESVTDRCTKAHEYLFLLSKSARYYWDADAIRERAEDPLDNQPEDRARASRTRETAPKMRQTQRLARSDIDVNGGGQGNGEMRVPAASRNKRSVWTIPTAPFPEAHFATFPPALVEPCVLAGSREGDTVLDPFVGSGTTAMVARQLGRRAIGIDLNAEYLAMAVRRVGEQLALAAPSSVKGVDVSWMETVVPGIEQLALGGGA